MTASRFVIFAAPRTGSNFLCSLLNSHPQILCHHGLFNPGGVHTALDHRPDDLGLGTIEERDLAPAAFLARVWQRDAGKRAVGFKFNSGEHAGAAELVLKDPRVLKVLLLRRNRIKTYVSERIADENGLWESYAGSHLTSARKVRVETPDLLRHVERNERYYAGLEALLRATGQQWLVTHYESLHPERADGAAARIVASLGLGRVPRLTAGSFKRNPDDLRALIANFEELQSELAGTPLEDDLYERPQSKGATRVEPQRDRPRHRP